MVFFGSTSDREFGDAALGILKEYQVSAKMVVASAHRAPQWLHEAILRGEREGCRVFICAAGGAAHLPGVAASLTQKPVLGVALPAKYLGGFDSLMSLAQMPSGVPVALCGLGETGMKNAAYLAMQILALSNEKLALKLKEHRLKLEEDNRRANQ